MNKLAIKFEKKQSALQKSAKNKPKKQENFNQNKSKNKQSASLKKNENPQKTDPNSRENRKVGNTGFTPLHTQSKLTIDVVTTHFWPIGDYYPIDCNT